MVAAVVAGQDGHADARRQSARGGLVAERTHRFWPRAYPGNARVGHRLGEVRVLGQEAVTRMDRVGASAAGRVKHRGHVEVAAAQRDELVSGAGPPSVRLVLGDEREAGDPELAAGARNAHDQLAAVGDEQAPD